MTKIIGTSRSYENTSFCFFLAQQPPVGQGLLFHEISRSHNNDAPQSVGLLLTSDQLVAETSI